MALKETFYISHGSPALVIDDTIPAWKFLKSWKEVFPQRPSSILVISGHWDTAVPTVNVVDHNETIYDFYGFPKEMYKLKYPAPGAPDLAKRVKELLQASGLSRVDEDTKRGLDHGAWVPLMLMYPEADIPVCQLSVSSQRDGTYHYNLGKALAPLKDEGVLIIGSGSATHNMRALGPRNTPPAPWAVAFDSWLKNSLIQGRYEEVNHFDEKAPYAKLAHPCPDHFFPLHVAMGAAGENSKAKVVHDSWDVGSISYASFGFTAATSYSQSHSLPLRTHFLTRAVPLRTHFLTAPSLTRAAPLHRAVLPANSDTATLHSDTLRGRSLTSRRLLPLRIPLFATALYFCVPPRHSLVVTPLRSPNPNPREREKETSPFWQETSYTVAARASACSSSSTGGKGNIFRRREPKWQKGSFYICHLYFIILSVFLLLYLHWVLPEEREGYEHVYGLPFQVVLCLMSLCT